MTFLGLFLIISFLNIDLLITLLTCVRSSYLVQPHVVANSQNKKFAELTGGVCNFLWYKFAATHGCKFIAYDMKLHPLLPVDTSSLHKYLQNAFFRCFVTGMITYYVKIGRKFRRILIWIVLFMSLLIFFPAFLDISGPPSCQKEQEKHKIGPQMSRIGTRKLKET